MTEHASTAIMVPTATLAEAVYEAIRAGDDLCVIDMECLLMDPAGWVNESDSEVAERLRATHSRQAHSGSDGVDR